MLTCVTAHLFLHDWKNLLDDALGLAILSHSSHFGYSFGAYLRLCIPHQEFIKSKHLVIGYLFRNVLAEAGSLFGNSEP